MSDDPAHIAGNGRVASGNGKLVAAAAAMVGQMATHHGLRDPLVQPRDQRAVPMTKDA